MDDLKKWIGRKFLDFCKSDPEDEREIHYEMMTGDMSKKTGIYFQGDRKHENDGTDPEVHYQRYQINR